jgi:hypothetical protein
MKWLKRVKSKSSLYIKEKFNDTVFSANCESKSFIPRFILESQVQDTISESRNKSKYPRNIQFGNSLSEVSGYILYTFISGDAYHTVFYDKYANKKLEIDLETGTLKDDIAGGPNFYPKFCSENKFYASISVTDLKMYIKSDDFKKAIVLNPIKKERLEKLATTLKESDNPVIIILFPKNFE